MECLKEGGAAPFEAAQMHLQRDAETASVSACSILRGVRKLLVKLLPQGLLPVHSYVEPFHLAESKMVEQRPDRVLQAVGTFPVENPLVQPIDKAESATARLSQRPKPPSYVRLV